MKAIVLALLLIFGFSPAIAQTGDRLAALAAARDLLVSVGFERQMEQSGMAMANAVFEQNVATLEKKRGESMPADLKQAVRTVLNEEIGAMLAEMKRTALDDASQIYADYFSAEELRRLAVLNADPVTRKAQSLMPQMLPKLAQIGLKVAAERQPALQQKIKEAIDQWSASQTHKGSTS